MKRARRQHSSCPAPDGVSALKCSGKDTPKRELQSSAELAELRSRLSEAEETLRAIRTGEADALVIEGKQGTQVFTLEGADQAYRVLIESMNEGALTLAADMMILYANQCFAQMVKSPLEKVMGSSFGRFLSADDLAALEPLVRLPGKSNSKIQVQLNAGDGTCLPVQISIRPLPTTGSKGAAITMVVADMTQARHIEELLRNERIRVEAALGESEAKLKMAFASMTEAIFIADASGRLTDFNDEFVRYHRFKNRDECRRTIADWPKYFDKYFADGSPAPPDQWAMARALQGETASDVEYRLCIKETGETWWGSYSFGPIMDKEGGFAGAVVSCRDVTGRKQLEQDKAEALQLLDTLLTHAPVGFAFFDLDLRFVRINERLAAINGYSVAAHLGRPMAEILPTFAPVLKEMAAHILTTGQPVLDHEFSGETASAPGVARHWHASWYPVRDERGGIIGFGAVVDEITERKRAEEVLRVSEERFRLITENKSEGLMIFDPRGHLLYQNPASLRIHGFWVGGSEYKTHHYLPPIWQVSDEQGRPLPVDQWPGMRALRGERFENMVLHARCSDTGLEFDASYNGCPIYDASGKLSLAFVTIREITEQRKAEKALASSRIQLQSILDGTPAIAYAFDLEERFLLANSTLAELLGSAPEQMIGKRRHEFMPRKDAEWHDANDRKVFESGRAMEFEEHSEIKGRSITWLTAKFPLRDADGEIYAVAGISADITERKRVEDTVRLSEAKLRDQLVWLALLEQITRAINNHLDFKCILEVVTKNLEDNLPVDFCCVCLFDEQARNCEVVQVGSKSAPLAIELAMPEHTMISLDCVALTQAALGELSYLPDVREMAFPFPQRLAKGGLRSLVLAPLPLEGNVIGFLLVARRAAHSFTNGECEFLQQLGEHVALACHQAELHNALQIAHDDLRRTQQTNMQRERLRALGQMASGITHDISNAISPVTLYTASLLEHEPDLSVRARDYLQTIHQSVQNVAETIARMREFCRQGEAQVVLTAIHLNHVAQQALDLTRARWNDSSHELGIVIQTEVRLAEDLPEIMGVESEVRDAVVNLILNALDAMPGGGMMTLRTVNQMTAPGTGGTPDARQACLELMDTGIGMDEDTRRRCLEPFFTTKGEHGSGMGLAMVYGMITRHQAGIEIESTPGHGTTVRMLFPVGALPSKGVCQPLQAKPESLKQRILFIDDDPLLIKSMRDTLEAEGHSVVTAAGGQEGIQVFIHAQERHEAFTVVITDLGMPHVDGRKVARAVKAASPSTPVILLTGWGQQLVAEGDIPAHVDRLLSKPPGLTDLREALAACCPPHPFKPRKA